MARITVEEVYNGAKYDVMSAAMAEYLRNGCPPVYDERTWLEMLLVKHALIAAEKMKNEGEAFISGFKLAARIMTEVLCKPLED